MASEAKTAATRSSASSKTAAKAPAKKTTATAAKASPTKKAVSKAAPKSVAPKTEAPVEKPKAPRKKAVPKNNASASGPLISVEERLRRIEEAAYYIAEKRGFSAGNPAEDWLLAERQIDNALLSAAPQD